MPYKARESLKRMFRGGEDCLRIELLAGLLDGSLDPMRTASVQGHIRQCAYCRNELALLSEFRSVQPRTDEAASTEGMASELHRRMSETLMQSHRRESRWLRNWRLPEFAPNFSWRGFSLAAASLLVVVAVGNYYWQQAGPGRPIVITKGPEVWRSERLTALTPIGNVESAPEKLRWRQINGAGRYQVRVLEVDQKEIWRGESKVPELTLPADLRSRMVPGRSFLWEVDALDSAGRKVASSNLQQFYILSTQR